MYIKTLFIAPLFLVLACFSLTAQSTIQLAEGSQIEADNSMRIYTNNLVGTGNESFKVLERISPNSARILLNLSNTSENFISSGLKIYGGLTVKDTLYSEEGILFTPHSMTVVLDEDDNSSPLSPAPSFEIRDGGLGGDLLLKVAPSVQNLADYPVEIKRSLEIDGNLNVTGSISKGGGTFRIDHPLDPENKYLYHSFIESPDMMNIYNGNAKTDDEGFAIIELPEYFEALNVDYRYQLTVLEAFAFAVVREKIKKNIFTIQTSEPNVEVSWQVTGIRNDVWAQENRVQVEVEKDPARP